MAEPELNPQSADVLTPTKQAATVSASAAADSPSVRHFIIALLLGGLLGCLPLILGSLTEHKGIVIGSIIGVWIFVAFAALVALARHANDRASGVLFWLIKIDDSAVLALWIHGFTFGYASSSAFFGIVALL